MGGAGGCGLGEVQPLELSGEQITVTLDGSEYLSVPVTEPGGGFFQLLAGEAASLLPSGSLRKRWIDKGVVNHKLRKVRCGAGFWPFLLPLRGYAVRH